MKKLLLSTALVATMSAPAFAQNADEMFRQEASQTELHASEFIGMRVYRTDNADAEAYEGVQDAWEDIGEINDVVFSRDGSVEAVLVDIGGFLGIGENQVAVDMDSIKFVSDSATADQENDFFLVLNAPRGALEEAPVYGAMGEQAAESDDQQSAASTEGAEMTDENSAESGAAAADQESGDQATDTADAGEATQTEQESDEVADSATGDGAENTDAENTDMAASDAMTDDDAAATPEAGATEGQTSDGTGLVREGYVTATENDLVVDDLTGAAAFDTNDKRVGEVSELLMTEDGKIQAAIVDVGGFLGIGEKPVQLEMSKLDILRAEDGQDLRVYISISEEELEALPEYEQ